MDRGMNDIYTRVHIITDRPSIETSPSTYPSMAFGDGIETSLTISVGGDYEDRLAFAARLREVADFFEAWTARCPACEQPNGHEGDCSPDPIVVPDGVPA